MPIPVLIVGAGPIGLALAGDLGFRGVSCLLIEKGDGRVIQPKMERCRAVDLDQTERTMLKVQDHGSR